MNSSALIVAAALAGLVAGVRRFFKTRAGARVGRFLPVPFWIYFLPIVLGTAGVFPDTSSAYGIIARYFLPAALFLMLVGAPVREMAHLGPTAVKAMAAASAAMFVSVIVSFVMMGAFMPPTGWQAAGTLLATWVGGSANMLAVKEILRLPEEGLAPLILVDTFLSYAWMALLMIGAGHQSKIDGWLNTQRANAVPAPDTDESLPSQKWVHPITVIIVGIAIAFMATGGGKSLGRMASFLSPAAWAVLLATTLGVGGALTPARSLEAGGATTIGSFALYMVLATIGAQTRLTAAVEAPIYLLFGAMILCCHGLLLMFVGKWLRIPVHLLAVASQANVGGPVSAPIVAGIYRPGSAHMGVVMAIGGAVAGTYVGAFGGWICLKIFQIL